MSSPYNSPPPSVPGAESQIPAGKLRENWGKLGKTEEAPENWGNLGDTRGNSGRLRESWGIIGNVETQGKSGNLGKFGETRGYSRKFGETCGNESTLHKSAFHLIQRRGEFWLKFEKTWENFGNFRKNLGKFGEFRVHLENYLVKFGKFREIWKKSKKSGERRECRGMAGNFGEWQGFPGCEFFEEVRGCVYKVICSILITTKSFHIVLMYFLKYLELWILSISSFP